MPAIKSHDRDRMFFLDLRARFYPAQICVRAFSRQRSHRPVFFVKSSRPVFLYRIRDSFTERSEIAPIVRFPSGLHGVTSKNESAKRHANPERELLGWRI